MNLGAHVVSLVSVHPAVAHIELVGSRARGRSIPESDWDFALRTPDFPAVAQALPELVAALEPLTEQWDRLSDEQCWMLVLAGPVKVDLIFPDEPHVHEPPWHPSADTLAPLDAHFWDWTLWLHAKEAGGKSDVVDRELRKLAGYLLRPLGEHRIPVGVADAVAMYRVARDEAERRFGCTIPRRLEQAVAPRLVTAARTARGVHVSDRLAIGEECTRSDSRGSTRRTP